MGSKQKNLEKRKESLILSIAILAILVMGIIIFSAWRINQNIGNIPAEIARSMTYEQVQEGENIVEQTGEHVTFDAFFLRDLDGDGYAEALRGACRQIGKQDTLYMELNVLTEGSLKDGKIQINGQNFYLQTALPKDNELKSSYIGANIKEIELNEIKKGTQKTLMGVVRCGDYLYNSTRTAAIGLDTNNYSRNDNEIILTGTYVDIDGNETPITKTVTLSMDWYGTTKTEIPDYFLGHYNQNQQLDITQAIDEENGTLNLNFMVLATENNNELLLSNGVLEVTVPEISGYKATNAIATGNNIEYTYNEETGKLTISRKAQTDETGKVTTNAYEKTYYEKRYNEYYISLTYPIEAYQKIGEDTVTIKVPVEAYYEGYNNPNSEFSNPYKSNVAKDTLIINYSKPVGKAAEVEVIVGKYLYNPTRRYVVSKEKPIKIYNEISNQEQDDIYKVQWYVVTGTQGESTGWTLKETRNGEAKVVDEFIKDDNTQDSMENITANVGIYFSNPVNMLGEDGFIRVYDEETDDLLVTFTSDNWNTYTETNPYKYNSEVKHIRVETSDTKANTAMSIYNVKKLDDKYITENYTREEFDNLKYIESALVGYLGGNYTNTDTHQARYEAPYSIATISLSNNALSTQTTEKNEKITITAQANSNENKQGWVDGSFLVKLPEEILTVEINSVKIDNNQVQITSYELVEKDGCKCIKINTQNKNTNEQSYVITIDADITPDPRSVTVSKNVELYASNENAVDYYYKAEDIYDVNSNLNTTEQINKTTTGISLVSPNSLLTNQTISKFDDNETIVISPEIADITPKYDNTISEATIGVQVKNNYSSTIREVTLIGKIPFEGNTYVISGGDLKSTFTTTMKNTGITVPQELQGKVTVYYSENEVPTKDLSDSSNNWKTANQVTDWSKIKTYAIDFGDTIIDTQKEYVFYYTVQIPEGVEYNEISYSHHGIYFALDTEAGKYRTKTEPNKIGLRIAEKYNLELTKYQKGKNKKVEGATYSVAEVQEDGTVLEGKSATTDSNGLLKLYNLYAEKVYEIREIKSPKDYALNDDVVRFIAHANRQNGQLTVEKVSGETKDELRAVKNTDEDYKIEVQVEDEAKAKLKITKLQEGTTTKLEGVVYNLTGEGLPETGKRLRTNSNGEITVTGLTVGAEYTLQEVEAEGYYLGGNIKFKVNNNNGTYGIQITEGTVKTSALEEENSLPVATIEIEDEKIPTYDLEISKIKKVTNLAEEGNTEELTYLEGAKFKLYKDGKELGNFVSDANGKITISNLYQYVDGKDFEATYVLKEVLPPEGYSKIKDTTFKVQEVEGELKFIEELQDGQTAKRYTADGNTLKVMIEDTPSFKLTKKDGETELPLANIKFAIYNMDNGEIPATNSKGVTLGTKETINGREYYVLTTDSNGEITADLPEGLYKAVEVEAPEKYDIKNNTYYFGIGASREPQMVTVADYGKMIGGTSDEEVTSITKTSDGGYIVGGYFLSKPIITETATLTRDSTNGATKEGFIIKYNAEGEEEWAESIGGSGTEHVECISETSDKGYIVAGFFSTSNLTTKTTILTNKGGLDAFIIKYNAEGEEQWAKSLGGGSDESIKAILTTKDGGYIIGGYFLSNTLNTETTTLTRVGRSIP